MDEYDQLIGSQMMVENLSNWFGIGKGIADLIIQYAEEPCHTVAYNHNQGKKISYFFVLFILRKKIMKRKVSARCGVCKGKG